MQCHPLDFVGSSDHHVILSIIILPAVRDEEHYQTIWLWEYADWHVMWPAPADIAWDPMLSGDP